MEPDFNPLVNPGNDLVNPGNDFLSRFMDTAPFVLNYLPWLIIALTIFGVVALWKIYQKAGRPGWECIVPVYSSYMLLKIVGKPTWWIILFFIPVVWIIPQILICLALAQVFGKGAGFAIGLIFLPFIFLPILAFDKSKYIGFGGVLAPVNTNPLVVPPLNPTVMPSANTPTNPPVNPPTANPGQ
jgi:hypothetical protein